MEKNNSRSISKESKESLDGRLTILYKAKLWCLFTPLYLWDFLLLFRIRAFHFFVLMVVGWYFPYLYFIKFNR